MMSRMLTAPFRDLVAALNDVASAMGAIIAMIASWLDRHRWALWVLACVCGAVLIVCVALEPITLVYVSAMVMWVCVLTSGRW